MLRMQPRRLLEMFPLVILSSTVKVNFRFICKSISRGHWHVSQWIETERIYPQCVWAPSNWLGNCIEQKGKRKGKFFLSLPLELGHTSPALRHQNSRFSSIWTLGLLQWSTKSFALDGELYHWLPWFWGFHIWIEPCYCHPRVCSLQTTWHRTFKY